MTKDISKEEQLHAMIEEYRYPEEDYRYPHEDEFLFRIEEMNTLLDGGANINARNEQGETLLFSAIENMCPEPTPLELNIAHLLLDRGADVNRSDWSGRTPLHIAVSDGHFEMVAALLDKGADMEARDGMDRTPLFYPNRHDYHNYFEMTKYLLERGANYMARDKYGRTLLHRAAGCHYYDIMLNYLVLDVDVDSRDDKGETPLFYAVSNECAFDLEWKLKTIRFLLENGANVNTRNNAGQTPLDVVLPDEHEVETLLHDFRRTPEITDTNDTISNNEQKQTSPKETTMDIYSFIRSPEVAEHCRSLGKTWNTLEMAVIIDRSNRTITEKHAAWTELVEHYPDMAAIPNYHGVQFDSVHAKIVERISYENQAIEWFKTPENGMFYTYRLESWGPESSHPYTTFEKAVAKLKDMYTQDKAPYFYLERNIADDREGGISSRIDYNGDLYYIHAWCSDEIHAKWFPDFKKCSGKSDSLKWYGFEFAKLFFIDIPIPFEYGDILTSVQHGRQKVFVLDDAYIIDNPERYARCLSGELADGGDMSGNGLFVNDVGLLYWDHADSGYDTWVSYQGELEGNNRLLHYVNLYLNDEIGLTVLLYMQCKIVTEHTLNNKFDLDEHDRYISEWLYNEKLIKEK